ncbi:hypothetical protein [Brachybacterium nesterenkovii]|uniref:hypothetical protein n=1 Tax=Brachybacterium nesterenkovii TaxID=47847 RepID=UPI003219BE7B
MSPLERLQRALVEDRRPEAVSTAALVSIAHSLDRLADAWEKRVALAEATAEAKGITLDDPDTADCG